MKRAVVVAAPAATFAVALGGSGLAAVVAGLLVVVVLAGVSTNRPATAAPIAVAAIALIPIYWGRRLGGFGLAAIPVTIAAAALAPAALRSVWRFRAVGLDAAVAVFVVFRSVAFFVNYDAGSASGFLTQVAAAYVPFRLLGLIPGMRRRLTVAVVTAGAALAVLARFEGSGDNVFFRLFPVGYQAPAWARPELRFGTVRAEGSFGHPIAFGLFLALALVLTVAVLFTTDRRRTRAQAALTVAAVLVLVALLDTLSRGPLLVGTTALVGWTWYERRRVTPWRVVGGGVAAATLLAFTPALIIVSALWSSSRGDTREARSAEYRLAIASVVTDPDEFTLLGRRAEGLGSGTNLVGRQVGFKSLDNEYVVVYVSGGALSLLAFLWIVAAVIRTALAPKLDALDRAWALSLASAMVGLVSVALLTQYTSLFWIAAALVACVAQEGRKSSVAAAFSDGRVAAMER